MLKQLFIVIGLALLSFGVNAQSNQFSLEQCVDYGIKNNRAMKNSKIDMEIASSKVWETIAIGLPQVNANAQMQYFINIPTQLFPDFISPALYGILNGEGVRDSTGKIIPRRLPSGRYTPTQLGTKYNGSIGIDASMILFDGSYLAGLQASATYKKLSLNQADRTEVDTRVSITKGYYNVLVGNERIELLNANVARLKKTMDDTKALYENGFVERTDYNRLEVLYNNLLVEQRKYAQILGLGLLSLKFQMGMPLTDSLVLTDKLDKKGLQPSLERIDKVNYELRPDYNAALTAQKLNKLDLRRAKLSYLPSIVAFGSYSRNSPQNNFSDVFTGTTFPTTLVGIKASIPIFGGFKKYQQLHQAQLALHKSDNDLESFKNGIDMEAKSTQILYNSAVASLASQERNIELAKEVLRVAKAKYEQGLGSSLEVISAETSLKEAETNYIASLSEALAARVDMDRAQGLIK